MYLRTLYDRLYHFSSYIKALRSRDVLTKTSEVLLLFMPLRKPVTPLFFIFCRHASALELELEATTDVTCYRNQLTIFRLSHE
jgi:hypothetical protein